MEHEHQRERSHKIEERQATEQTELINDEKVALCVSSSAARRAAGRSGERINCLTDIISLDSYSFFPPVFCLVRVKECWLVILIRCEDLFRLDSLLIPIWSRIDCETEGVELRSRTVR